MRKIILIIIMVFSLFIINIYSQTDTSKVKWLGFKETRGLFEKVQRPVLIYFHDNLTDSSNMMLNETFGLEEVANYINVLFYPVKINIYTKDTITFFDGTTYFNSGKNGKVHDIVVHLLGENASFPSMLLFTKEAVGSVFQGYKDRDHVFPLLIYYAEAVKTVDYAKFEKNYFISYPIGQKQIITRLIIKWKTMDEVFELVKTNPKKVLINLYDNYSISSTMQRLKTYNDPVIAEYLNQKFYCTNLDVKSKDTINFLEQKYINEMAAHGYHQLAIAMLNGQMSFPVFLLFDENMKLLDRFYGYMPPDDFEPLIHFIGDDFYKNQKWEEYKQNFKGSFEEIKNP